MSERGRFADQVVVVTGATRGIGLACARAFAAEGARVVGTGRDQQALASLADEVALALTLDVTDPISVEVGAAAILDGVGVPDVLVHSAGVGLFCEWQQVDDADLQRLLDVNLLGVHRLSRALLPAMVGRGSGAVVVVSSVAGLRGFADQVAYVASKHAVTGWARAMAAALGPQGVRVVSVCPPAVDTGFFERAGAPDFRSRGVPMMAPEQVADAVLDAAEGGQGEVLVGRRAKVIQAVSTLAPGLPGRLRRVARILPWVVALLVSPAAWAGADLTQVWSSLSGWPAVALGVALAVGASVVARRRSSWGSPLAMGWVLVLAHPGIWQAPEVRGSGALVFTLLLVGVLGWAWLRPVRSAEAGVGEE